MAIPEILFREGTSFHFIPECRVRVIEKALKRFYKVSINGQLTRFLDVDQKVHSYFMLRLYSRTKEIGMLLISKESICNYLYEELCELRDDHFYDEVDMLSGKTTKYVRITNRCTAGKLKALCKVYLNSEYIKMEDGDIMGIKLQEGIIEKKADKELEKKQLDGLKKMERSTKNIMDIILDMSPGFPKRRRFCQ